MWLGRGLDGRFGRDSQPERLCDNSFVARNFRWAAQFPIPTFVNFVGFCNSAGQFGLIARDNFLIVP
jgi:hypothetical protein